MVTVTGGAGSPLSLEYRKQCALSAFTEIVRAPEPPPATSCGCTTTRPPPSSAKGTGMESPEAFRVLTAPLRPPATLGAILALADLARAGALARAEFVVAVPRARWAGETRLALPAAAVLHRLLELLEPQLEAQKDAAVADLHESVRKTRPSRSSRMLDACCKECGKEETRGLLDADGVCAAFSWAAWLTSEEDACTMRHIQEHDNEHWSREPRFSS